MRINDWGEPSLNTPSGRTANVSSTPASGLPAEAVYIGNGEWLNCPSALAAGDGNGSRRPMIPS